MPTQRLYKCEGFNKKCYMENNCVIKNTFNPNHIYKRSRYVKDMVRNNRSLIIKCSADGTNKEVRPCQ